MIAFLFLALLAAIGVYFEKKYGDLAALTAVSVVCCLLILGIIYGVFVELS
jgi:hypothetical protein